MKGTQTHLEFIPERTTDFVFAAFAEEFGLIGTLGKELFSTYVVPFEISSILFLSAMVGAVVIGKKE